MTSLANFDIQKHNDETKKSIKNLDKPLSSFNYYIKEMRENWNNLSEDDKDKYMLKSKADNQRHAGEKQEILNKSKEEIKKLKIFLIQTTGRVPCVGLDNGFSSYTVIGPMDAIELFTEEEKKKLEAKGVSPNDIGKYKTINGFNSLSNILFFDRSNDFSNSFRISVSDCFTSSSGWSNCDKYNFKSDSEAFLESRSNGFVRNFVHEFKTINNIEYFIYSICNR